MQRTIVEPADVSQNPLNELKKWLGISSSNEDELLIDLLSASLDMCEAFIGQPPLSHTIEDRVEPVSGWNELDACPVLEIQAIETIAPDGSRSALVIQAEDMELTNLGKLRLNFASPPVSSIVAVQMIVGLALNWDKLPPGLSHGIIRFAAHLYWDRDQDRSAKKETIVPPSVLSLWKPWLQLRIL